MMIDHVSVGVSDLLRSIRFYDAALLPLGARRLWTVSDAAGYGVKGHDEPFAIRQIAPESVHGGGAGAHIAFSALSRKAVTEFYSSALENGGADDGPPGLHEEYGPGYFAAFVCDPDGNRIEAVLHE
jgi:catechol 2,3-dioxygenase-like lactoylglutathione lyase family enzyme